MNKSKLALALNSHLLCLLRSISYVSYWYLYQKIEWKLLNQVNFGYFINLFLGRQPGKSVDKKYGFSKKCKEETGQIVASGSCLKIRADYSEDVSEASGDKNKSICYLAFKQVMCIAWQAKMEEDN